LVNYFLVDSRGRGVKSYLKVPPPIINDPMAELIKVNDLSYMQIYHCLLILINILID